MAGGSRVGVATAILKGIGAPVNQRTLGSMVGWFNAEGGHWNNSASFNPLNTTEGAPGASSINGVGVKAYQNWQQGINATVQTLRNGHYGRIIQAFHNSNPQAVIQAIGSSPWGTSGSTVAQTINSALGQHYAPPADVARAMSLPGGTMRIPGRTTTNVGGALVDSLLSESMSPVSETGSVPSMNPLADAARLIAQGGFTHTTPGRTVELPNTTIAGIASSKGGDLNPLQHFTLGRTDMGVDANAAPGTPILAPNDAKVVAIIPNWYQGQPYVALRLTAGPNKGKVIYVAEQIATVPHMGQSFRRGQPITTYAHSGTGIEIGWADPKNPYQTLAQATGQLGTGDHSNAPAGAAFRNYLGH